MAPEIMFKVTVTVREGQTFPHSKIRLLSEEFMCWSTSTYERGVTYSFLEKDHAIEFAKVVRAIHVGK